MMKLLTAAGLLCASVIGAIAQTAPSLPNGTTMAGHLVTAPGSTGVPTLSGASCGTPTLALGSSDLAGSFTTGGTTTCKVTFGTPFAARPFCIVQDQTTIADSGYTFATSGNQYTGFTMGTTVNADVITWICIGQQGN